MQVLITVTKGIIEDAVFFDNPERAVLALSEYVKTMDPEHDDACVYDERGLIANAKHFLDENDRYRANEPLIQELSKDRGKAIYIIGNPTHRLGFMVASSDDPLGFTDPVEALSELGQMRKEFGSHLKLYRVRAVSGPLADKARLQTHNAELDLEDFDYSLVEEHLV
ncbi:MAG: hypothetical protein CVU57_23380 [Deltaproteobacteria bacterium HGW-Deltaproteobacteria-15]|jgi:hypothetical protein|nr:MAG: hypothetical protein CVU57_23380 [Deltaproteobacteria bacterium HGW-Deltaproteobacteria-15]